MQPYQPNFHKLKIEQPVISLFASGVSIDSLREEELNHIKNNSFLITTNYPLALKYPKFSPHAIAWSDTTVSKFMEDWYANREKDCLWISRSLAYNAKSTYPITKDRVDFWFEQVYHKLKGNFTLYWIIQLLRKYFPEKTICLFGLDGYIPEHIPMIKGVVISKWYDYYTDYDSKDRKFDRYNKAITRFTNDMEKDFKEDPKGWEKVWNCTVNSRVTYIKKKSFSDVIGSH